VELTSEENRIRSLWFIQKGRTKSRTALSREQGTRTKFGAGGAPNLGRKVGGLGRGDEKGPAGEKEAFKGDFQKMGLWIISKREDKYMGLSRKGRERAGPMENRV